MPLTEISAKKIALAEATRTLKSIQRNGLVSLKDIPTSDALPNPGLGTQNTQGYICVHYLNFVGSSHIERKKTFQIAT